MLLTNRASHLSAQPSRGVTPETLNAVFERCRDGSDEEFFKSFPVENGLFVCEGALRSKAPAERLWIIDADDTLWEDNLHYEEIISEVISYSISNGAPVSPRDLRQLIDDVEHRTIAEVGFGVEGFDRSMRESWNIIQRDYLPHVTEPTALLNRIIPYLRGVPYHIPLDTLSFLDSLRAMEREHVVLFTQGPFKTQIGKIYNSGLAPLFDGIAVGSHKRVEAYQELQRRLSVRPTEHIVVGNSLNSEVKPALALGFRAFHLDNPNSWHSVNSDTLRPDRYVTVRSLSEVLSHIQPGGK